VGNILKKAEGQTPTSVNAGAVVEPAERALAAALAVAPQADAAFDRGDYTRLRCRRWPR
jgi:glycyl-tRNA synthetase beta subunit